MIIKYQTQMSLTCIKRTELRYKMNVEQLRLFDAGQFDEIFVEKY